MDETGFLSRSIEINGNQFAYQVYVPVEYAADRAWSVILFLHGADESGQDGIAQTQVGLGPALKEFPERFPAIVIFPQTQRKIGWRGDMAELALAALAQTQQEFHVDEDRIYLTGVSMGGYGTWYLALQHPDLFAALVPVCGGLDEPSKPAPVKGNQSRNFSAAATRLRHLPVWIFHGADDEIVPATESRDMVGALQDTGASVRYTEYPGVGHDCWELAYRDPQLITWLLSQSRHQDQQLDMELEPTVQDEWI